MAAKRSRTAQLRRALDEIERQLKAAARGVDPAPGSREKPAVKTRRDGRPRATRRPSKSRR